MIKYLDKRGDGMMESTVKPREFIETVFIIVTMSVSVIGQIEPIRESFRPVMFILWGAFIFFLLFANFNTIKISRFSLWFILSYGLYLLFCFVLSFANEAYLDSNFISVLLPALMVTLAGEFFRPVATYSSMKAISLFFVLSALIYAIWVNITFFPSLASWYSLHTYAFVSKNSAAQIWSCSILLIVFILETKSKLLKVTYSCIALYFLFLCFLSQCRTALLGLGCVFVWYYFKRKSDNLLNKLFFYTAVLLFVAFVVFKWDFFSDFIGKAIFLGAQDNFDANQMSSGRIELYGNALSYIFSSPLIGNGKFYVDNHYLCVLAESGLLGFIIIESVWFMRIMMNLRYNGDYKQKLFLIALTIFYIVESMFEAFPPFGPGVTAMAFWFYSQVLTNPH